MKIAILLETGLDSDSVGDALRNYSTINIYPHSMNKIVWHTSHTRSEMHKPKREESAEFMDLNFCNTLVILGLTVVISSNSLGS
jgi:hypothetical protein